MTRNNPMKFRLAKKMAVKDLIVAVLNSYFFRYAVFHNCLLKSGKLKPPKILSHQNHEIKNP